VHHSGHGHHPEAGGADGQIVGVQQGVAAERGGNALGYLAGVARRDQRDVVFDAAHAGHVRGDEVSFVTLVLPAGGPGQRHEAILDLRPARPQTHSGGVG
jgi:hypothetical protein